ncbi:MAG: diguanylate cyclase [Zoogloeaceae bacterium]|jgi:diguanylate cyclase (GGDEF)-like protein|nr:diguanylate cyclase [Zoogloeaceae bacterium]
MPKTSVICDKCGKTGLWARDFVSIAAHMRYIRLAIASWRGMWIFQYFRVVFIMYAGIALRLSTVLAVLAILASGLTGYYAHDESRRLLMTQTEKNLKVSTQVVGQQLAMALRAAMRDMRVFAMYMRQPKNDMASSNLAFRRMAPTLLQVRPEYLQISIVEPRPNGEERHFFTQEGGKVIQREVEKGLLDPYIEDVARLSPGLVYLSDVLAYSQEEGKPERLTMLAITPVPHDRSGKSGLLVVLRVDVDYIAHQIQAKLPMNYQLHLTTRDGLSIYGPKTDGHNDRHLLQTQFPDVAQILAGKEENIVTGIQLDRQPDQADVAAAFQRVQITDFVGGGTLILGISEPLIQVWQEHRALANNMTRIVLFFSFLALIVAWPISQAVTRPLAQILESVRRFAARDSGGILPLPTRRKDEIGQLAKSVEEMQNQIRAQVAALEENHQVMMHIAHHDPLTGLPNRLTFFSKLDEAIAQAAQHGRKLAVLFVDLDHFKAINDTHGHKIGDAMLLEVAHRLRHGVRSSDTAARLAGDEFVVLLNPIYSAEEACLVAEKLLRRLNPHLKVENLDLPIEASIGVSIFPDHGDTPQTLLESADAAMYASKNVGRNVYSIAQPGVRRHREERRQKPETRQGDSVA